MVLDQGPAPLYYQLKNILKSKILSNELKGNRRLPSEAKLCIEYNVSRATVRQALSELMNGWVVKFLQLRQESSTFYTLTGLLTNLQQEWISRSCAMIEE